MAHVEAEAKSMEGEGIMVRVCYRSARSSKMREGFVSILKDGCTLCFFANVQFVSLHPI